MKGLMERGEVIGSVWGLFSEPVDVQSPVSSYSEGEDGHRGTAETEH